MFQLHNHSAPLIWTGFFDPHQ